MVLPTRPQRHELPKLTGNETELELYQMYADVLSLYKTDMDEWELWADDIEDMLY